MLNAITKKDIYPLPRIDAALESMHGVKRFSSLDLHAGYCQFSGGAMHRHVVDLVIVMERVAQAGLSLKPKKCSFAMERLEYLGHELGTEGIRPLAILVDSVRRFLVPKDPAEVRRFVHLAGYYRRFVPNFGTKAAPLTKLFRKSTQWRWGLEEQAAFDELKNELTERPLLIYPDFTKPFKLVTDASAIGLGAALMQDHGNGDQPVAFASKVNSPTVAKYEITDLVRGTECGTGVRHEHSLICCASNHDEARQMSVPTFDGKDSDSLVFWAREIEIELSAGQIYDARAQVAFALSNLGGSALAWAMAREAATPGYFTSWSFMEQELRSTFLLANVAYHHRSNFLRCNLGKRSLHDYVMELHNLEAAWPAHPRQGDGLHGRCPHGSGSDGALPASAENL
ncbi:unnamed protein product [Phytophthora fragariaefolia]|uniref:Unnamed protein product n=1 Tax=Phytophthora fragariaefolia TaxID=1490495 RepID=A0A9W7CST2_9STRA|nr:unnamed protein product [Phytophthora fragariaefolia]